MYIVQKDVFFHVGHLIDGELDKSTVQCDLTNEEAIEFCQQNQFGSYKIAYSLHDAKTMIDYQNISSGIIIFFDKKDIFSLKFVLEVTFNSSTNNFECENYQDPIVFKF